MESLIELKRRRRNVTCVCVDGSFLPFETGSFSHVVAIHTLNIYQLAEMLHEIIRIQASDGKLSYVIPTEGGLLFYLGRLFVTGPHLKARYKLDVNFVMDREHIDAKLIKFLKFYFEKVEVNFWPIWFLSYCQ